MSLFTESIRLARQTVTHYAVALSGKSARLAIDHRLAGSEAHSVMIFDCPTMDLARQTLGRINAAKSLLPHRVSLSAYIWINYKDDNHYCVKVILIDLSIPNVDRNWSGVDKIPTLHVIDEFLTMFKEMVVKNTFGIPESHFNTDNPLVHMHTHYLDLYIERTTTPNKIPESLSDRLVTDIMNSFLNECSELLGANSPRVKDLKDDCLVISFFYILPKP